MSDANASPRLYRRHQRHANFARLRYSDQAQAFLKLESTRLSTTKATIFGDLTRNTAEHVAKASTQSGL